MSRAASRERLLTDSADSHEDATSRARQHQLWVQYILYARFAVKTTLYSDYANYLLVVVPFALISGPLGWNEAVVFILNFVAMFPLAALLSYSTEQLSASVGQIVGGLLNATFGNAVEMIVSRLYVVSRDL
jgi:Ca2+:H+ antiporter